MALDDGTLSRKLEADFRQFYYADLGDLFREDSSMTVRWVIDMIEELPDESRFVQQIRNDPLVVGDHLLIMIFDVLNQIFYQTSLSAAQALGKEYRKYSNKAPKPIERPTITPIEKPKPKFLTGAELKEYFKQQ